MMMFFPFKEGLARVERNGKYGFIDEKGSLIIPCIYDDVSSFNEGLASVKRNGKYGFIDKKGNIIVPFIYQCMF